MTTPCGCHILSNVHETIIWCPLHAHAEEMRDTLKEIADCCAPSSIPLTARNRARALSRTILSKIEKGD